MTGDWDDAFDFIDLWIIDKFNILPTDIKFLSLYDEQKLALYEQINLLPNKEDIAFSMKRIKRIKEIKSKQLEDFAKKETLVRMRMIFEKEGLDEKGIKERLNEYCKHLREIELKQVEKL